MPSGDPVATSIHILLIRNYRPDLASQVDAALTRIPGVMSSRTGPEGRAVIELDRALNSVTDVVTALAAVGFPAMTLS